ncbi:MAG: response regulator [Terriglobales bacterium]
MSSPQLASYGCCVAKQPVSANGKRPRVVVVDDEPSILEIWGAILTASGYSVECCSDATSALEAIAAGCDCVLTDYHMPLMTGVELIRAARKWSTAKFILMTGNMSSMLAEDAIGAGASCVLHKPTTAPQVLQKIESLCRG